MARRACRSNLAPLDRSWTSLPLPQPARWPNCSLRAPKKANAFTSRPLRRVCLRFADGPGLAHPSRLLPDHVNPLLPAGSFYDSNSLMAVGKDRSVLQLQVFWYVFSVFHRLSPSLLCPRELCFCCLCFFLFFFFFFPAHLAHECSRVRVRLNGSFRALTANARAICQW